MLIFRCFPHAQDPEQEGQPHPCRTWGLQKGARGCGSPPLHISWGWAAVGPPRPFGPRVLAGRGPQNGQHVPIAGFSSSLCSLCRLLAPGYTETHYTTDGQPVTVAPNHTVGARDGRPSSQNKGDDGFGVSQSLSFTTRIPGVPFQRCVPRVGGPSMSQAGPPELAASWLHPSSCPEGCWL